MGHMFCWVSDRICQGSIHVHVCICTSVWGSVNIHTCTCSMTFCFLLSHTHACCLCWLISFTYTRSAINTHFECQGWWLLWRKDSRSSLSCPLHVSGGTGTCMCTCTQYPVCHSTNMVQLSILDTSYLHSVHILYIWLLIFLAEKNSYRVCYRDVAYMYITCVLVHVCLSSYSANVYTHGTAQLSHIKHGISLSPFGNFYTFSGAHVKVINACCPGHVKDQYLMEPSCVFMIVLSIWG